jgi:hypothetical protein
MTIAIAATILCLAVAVAGVAGLSTDSTNIPPCSARRPGTSPHHRRETTTDSTPVATFRGKPDRLRTLDPTHLAVLPRNGQAPEIVNW